MEVAAPIPPQYVLPTPRPTVKSKVFATRPRPDQALDLTKDGFKLSDILIISTFVLLVLVAVILTGIVFNVVEIRKVSFSLLLTYKIYDI